MGTVGTRASQIQDGTLVERVSRELRAAILGGQLKPGQRISQVAVARQYGISRLPVREALRQLHSDGLVTVIPNGGARVVRLDAAELDEVYWLRERIEGAALAESVPRLSDEQIATARGSIEEMRSVENNGQAWVDADRRFHTASLAACPLPRVLQTIDTLWNLAEPYRRAFVRIAWGPALLGVQRFEHGLLLDAIERRDSSDAQALLQMHIRRTRLSLQRHPEVFNK